VRVTVSPPRLGMPRVRRYSGRAPWSPFIEFNKNLHFKVSIFLKKSLDVDNNDFYLRAKNQREIFHILGCVKVTNF
jgi:hypothetical protein